MSYVDDNLIPSEGVLYRTDRHWIVLVTPVIVGLFLGFVSLSILISPSPTEGASPLWMAFFALAIIVIVAGVLRWNSTEIAVTNKRVIIKTGVLTHRSLEIALNKVESIGVNQGIGGRMLNYGTIVVRGTGGTPEPFKEIASPMEFRHHVQEQMDSVQQAAVSATNRG